MINNVQQKLNIIVEECIRKHVGGSAFFDALDNKVKDVALVETLLEKVAGYYNLIVSGKFGIYVKNYLDYYKADTWSCILVNGGLREGKKIISLEPFKHFINNQEFVFLDDSFYSGKTRNSIKTELEGLGGRLSHTFVVYDGSPIREKEVSSLYRYYNEK